jgi:hypothetical protein
MIKDQAGMRTTKLTMESSQLISRRNGQFRASIQAQETAITKHMHMNTISVISKSFEPISQAALLLNKSDSNVS